MEIFDIVDEHGMPVGQTAEREQAHREGICHRTAHVWVVDRRPDGTWVLLQKRAACKDSFPGCFDTSSAGHIHAGDEPLPSALRELSEEIGITAAAKELSFAGTFRIRYDKEFHGRMFRDNEVAFVYVYDCPVDASALCLQADEVEEVRWFPLGEVLAAVAAHDPRFCVPSPGLAVLGEYLTREESHIV